MRLFEFCHPIEALITHALQEDEMPGPSRRRTKPPTDPQAQVMPVDPEAEEKARLMRLAKARGLDMSPPKVTPEQIIQAANAPPVARMLVTDKTTPAEISAFIRGKRRG